MKTAKQASVENETRDMQVVAQILDSKTGSRTPPITKTRKEFANSLRDFFPPGQWEKAFVLILADDSSQPGSLDFALAPLMTVASFVEHFATKVDLGDAK